MMNIKSKLKKAGYKALFDIDLFQEYFCLSLNEFTNPLQVLLQIDQGLLDITEKNIFLGYKPLVIAVPINRAEDKTCDYLSRKDQIKIIFHQNTNIEKKKNIAELALKLVEVKAVGDTFLFIYEGIKGEHRFISDFYKFTNNLYERFKKRKAGNVNLPGNLYDQVRIAYSVPRVISLISLGINETYNMFPTDLHGIIDDRFYVSSLRHEGKASSQVNELRKIVISTIEGSSFKEAYALGKNHMQDLKAINNFKVAQEKSEVLHLPLPQNTLEYKELELIDASLNIGIHKILIYKVIHQKTIDPRNSTLAHIHQYYQIWRRNQGVQTNYLIR